MMPIKDSAKLREAVSVFEQNLVACGIDASNVDYDKLADTRQKLWDELDRITDAHTAAQELDTLGRLIPNFDGVGGIGYQYDDESRVPLDVRIKQIAECLTTGQKEIEQ